MSPKVGCCYRYVDADLTRLLDWCRGREGFVLFNNMAMKEDALRFAGLLRGDRA